MSDQRAATRAYGILLGLYPSRFRREYRADMLQLLRDQCIEEPAWRVYSRAALDLAFTIPTQHVEAHMNRSPKHFVPLLYTAIAAAGAMLAIVGGTNTTMLGLGLGIAVVAGSLGAIAWRRAAPVRSTVATDGWWKLVVAGPCIVVGVILAAGAGVEAWFLGMILVFTAFVLTGIGLLMGIARLASRRSTTLRT